MKELSDEYSYIKDIDERYRFSETEEGLVIKRLLSMYLKEKQKNLEYKEKIIEKDKEIKKVKNDSLRDKLTGLYNRKGIFEYFKDTFANDTTKNHINDFSLVAIDLDHFKSINDTYGHNVGDDALKIVSEGMIRHFKKSDLLDRDGGDEFMVVVKDCDLSVLMYKANLMSKYITESIHKELYYKYDEFGNRIERPHDYTISFGVREMDLSKLIGNKTIEEFKQWFRDADKDELIRNECIQQFEEWFKGEKEYADVELYNQKEEHHSVRR